MKERLGLTTDQGVVITRVAPESPGARAGLAEKDVITAVDGAVVKAAGDVVKAVQAKKVEQQVTLTLLRGSQELTVVVTLGAAPQPPKPKPAPPPLGGFGDILGANPLEDLRSAKVELTDREGRKRTLEAVAGTVQAASATSLSLVPNGETAARTFQVTQETRTGFRARAEDLKAGDRVLVIAEDGKALSVVAGRSLAPRFWGFPFHRFMPWGGEPQPSPGKAF